MARPIKKGLDYFPQNTDIYSDRRMKRLMYTYGVNGFLVCDYIRSQCYRENGYWIKYDSDIIFDIMATLNNGLNEKQVNEILDMCMSLELFDAGIFAQYAILTSAEIQAVYVEAKQNLIIRDDIWLIEYKTRAAAKSARNIAPVNPVNEPLTPVNRPETPANEPISTQSKVKETKENKSKEKESNFFNGDAAVKEENLEALKNSVIADERYVSLICAKGVKHALVPGWLDAFNRLLVFKNIRHKPEDDYRMHFANWLVKIPNYAHLQPDKYSPVKDTIAAPHVLNSGDEKLKKLLGK